MSTIDASVFSQLQNKLFLHPPTERLQYQVYSFKARSNSTPKHKQNKHMQNFKIYTFQAKFWDLKLPSQIFNPSNPNGAPAECPILPKHAANTI